MNILEENETYEKGTFNGNSTTFGEEDTFMEGEKNKETNTTYRKSISNNPYGDEQIELKDDDLFRSLNDHFYVSNFKSEEKKRNINGNKFKLCHNNNDLENVRINYDRENYKYEQNDIKHICHMYNETSSIEMTYDGFLNDNDSKSRSTSIIFTDSSDCHIKESKRDECHFLVNTSLKNNYTNREPYNKEEADGRYEVEGENCNHGNDHNANQHKGDSNLSGGEKYAAGGGSSNGGGVPGGDGSGSAGNGHDGRSSNDEKNNNRDVSRSYHYGGHNESNSMNEDAPSDGSEDVPSEENEEMPNGEPEEEPSGEHEEEPNGEHEEEPRGEPEEEPRGEHEEEPRGEHEDEKNNEKGEANCQKDKPNSNNVKQNEKVPTSSSYTDLLNEINKLKDCIESMKKEKIHLLSKFKAYTLNNKKEIEELKVRCRTSEEEIAQMEENINKKEEEIAKMYAEIAKMKEDIARKDALIAKMEEEIARKDALIAKMEEEIARKDALIAKMEEEIARKDTLISKTEEALESANLKHAQEVSAYEETLERQKDLQKDLAARFESLSEENTKMNKEINTNLEVISKLSDEKHILRIDLEEKEKKIIMLESKKGDTLLDGKLREEDVLFSFLLNGDILICFKKNEEYFISPESIFEQKFGHIKKIPDPVQKTFQNELCEYEKKHHFDVKMIQEEKEKIEKEYHQYKDKVNTLINETNENYKNMEEQNGIIQDLNNTILKYEQDMQMYKKEMYNVNEKYKHLELEICKERNVTKQQIEIVSDLKKQMKKEKVELEKKYKELHDIETHKKISELKEMFSRKEKLLQDKIDALLYKIEKMTFSREENSHVGQTSVQIEDGSADLAVSMNAIDSVDASGTLGTSGTTDYANGANDEADPRMEVSDWEGRSAASGNRKGGEVPHTEWGSNEKREKPSTTNIPIYPNEYKKIKKKLETYELLISEEKKNKKKMIEHINFLKSQIKNYESINGNYEHVMYQKNIILNCISQIPAGIKIDDYVSVIYNSFNFSPKEIELINARRAKR
ncbi:conserved Plasmodium protein, unknown function [Plasmodium ovale wallikeri]|uniref:GRIP domain-containing protein n=2 Tax=Plasmodium ovale TaxID=36330 RepID=A0A1A8YTZ3_PLAOA|nr:conserved Plasmodium protein, unknown function [Plasmodium ovale wallikeri]SBT35123.1 conserved Plasmodium protein, unknown function [Plasmodium ovale wallikeri]SBT76914.1 conserved Plasmodium protein, unknown function [Plasmodium ovale]